MARSLRFRRTTILMVGCVGFLVGLAAAKLGAKLSPAWLLLATPLSVILYRKQSFITAVSIFVLLFIFGHLRGQNFIVNIDNYEQLNGAKVQLRATATTDAEYNDKKQLSFDVDNIKVSVPNELNLVGVIKVSGFGENAVYKGDNIIIKGKLYKTRGSRQASISYADIELVSRSNSITNNIRRYFSAGVSNVLPEPLAPFGLGLLIGQRTTLSKEVAAWLSIVGLTHIIAVSGYNLTIIVRFIHRLFANRSRYQTVMASCLTITLFLLMTGFSASIVRASIVCGLSLVAWYFGRKIRPLLLLLLTACLTAGWYPIYLWSDIGWYLSFLAFFGVLILAPLLTNRLLSKQPKALTSAVIETFCAQIMTLPLILYVFNEASAVALISNALIVPLVPLAMLFTLFAGLAGMIQPELLQIIALPARLMLTYILDLAHLLATIPYAMISAKISGTIMIGAFAIIAFISLVMWQKLSTKRDTITDENIYKMEPI